MKTRAELFREAKNGEITLQLVERFGNRDLPPEFTEKRKIGKVQTNGFYLTSSQGRNSFLEIQKASLMEYDGQELRIYNPGYREMTEKEKTIMEELKKITETEDYKQRAKNDLLSDGSSTYWQEKKFFHDKAMEHLNGETKNGAYLDKSRYSQGLDDCIKDEKVKGEVVLIYKVEREVK